MKNFQSSNNMFAENSLAGKFTVSSFLLKREWMKFGFLRWYLTVGMQLRQTQVACIA